MTCWCCEHRRAALLCPDCFAASCAGRRSDKCALEEQRDAAEQQLAALAAGKVRRRPSLIAWRRLGGRASGWDECTTPASMLMHLWRIGPP